MPLPSLAMSMLASARCVSCGGRGLRLCDRCAFAVPAGESNSRPEGVDRAIVAWRYSGLARRLVLGLKLRGDLAAAEPLARAVRRMMLQAGSHAGALAWVPGRTADVRQRGYDHARVIAEALAALTGLPSLPLLERRRDAVDQTLLSAGARRRNLEGVFCARSSPLNVAIVDDLLTTGSTASACAFALRAAGADYVEVLAPCRAGPHTVAN